MASSNINTKYTLDSYILSFLRQAKHFINFLTISNKLSHCSNINYLSKILQLFLHRTIVKSNIRYWLLGTSVEVESISTLQNMSPIPSRHMKVNRNNLHVPDPTTGSKLTINTAFGSQTVDNVDDKRISKPRRILYSIGKCPFFNKN